MTRVERSRAGAPRRRGTRTLTAVVSAALATAAVGCSSGDDGGAETTSVTPAPTTTQPRVTTTVAQATTTTGPTEPTEPPTTETAPPTTTEADLEAQIAADYVRSWELRNELTSNPTLENLDARVAEIAAPGTPEFDSLKAFVEELVALGERTAPDEPGPLLGDGRGRGRRRRCPARDGRRDVCYVDNRLRVDASG